jgi:hypothetical protein
MTTRFRPRRSRRLFLSQTRRKPVGKVSASRAVRTRWSWRFSLLIGLAVLLGLAGLAGVRLQPVLATVATAEARRVATDALGEALSAELVAETDSGQSLVSFTVAPKPSGLTLAQFHLHRIAIIQQQAVEAARNNLLALKRERVPVPVGSSLLGSLVPMAPVEIPMRISLLGTVHSAVFLDLQTTGLNQAVHVLNLELTAEVHVLAPFVSHPVTVSSRVPLAILVFSGPVPGAYSSSGWQSLWPYSPKSSTKFSQPG